MTARTRIKILQYMVVLAHIPGTGFTGFEGTIRVNTKGDFIDDAIALSITIPLCDGKDLYQTN
jgi:hypothetical protein